MPVSWCTLLEAREPKLKYGMSLPVFGKVAGVRHLLLRLGEHAQGVCLSWLRYSLDVSPMGTVPLADAMRPAPLRSCDSGERTRTPGMWNLPVPVGCRWLDSVETEACPFCTYSKCTYAHKIICQTYISICAYMRKCMHMCSRHDGTGDRAVERERERETERVCVAFIYVPACANTFTCIQPDVVHVITRDGMCTQQCSSPPLFRQGAAASQQRLLAMARHARLDCSWRLMVWLHRVCREIPDSGSCAPARLTSNRDSRAKC